jgi:outer membrane protein OmpA-like peptidoglycan-associated protein
MQQALGNRALAGLAYGHRIQARLAVSEPDDPLEREADRVADKVMRMPAQVSSQAATGATRHAERIQRLCSGCEEELHRETALEEEEPLRQAKPEGTIEAYVGSLPARGEPLALAAREFMEPRFGVDFGQVRVHTDAQADRSAESVNALAYTTGQHIVFRAGQYDPATPAGQRLLAHELAHVVQQGAAGDASVQRAPARPEACPPPGGMACPPATSTPGSVTNTLRFASAVHALSAAQQEEVDIAAASWHAAGGVVTVRVDGYASAEGDCAFNWDLSCRRVQAIAAELQSPSDGSPGIPAANIEVFAHGESDEAARALAPNRRATISIPTLPTTTHRFRAAAWSFLSCAPCNPFTDDGTLGVSPPTTEPALSTTHRQMHFIEAELSTHDGRTIASGSLAGAGNDVGTSEFCGAAHVAHIVSSTAAGTVTRVTSATGAEGIQFESELTSRVGAVVPATLPGSPCGFLGTNPLIPVIGNTFRMRLFADGTRESEFVAATLYPSHFIYEDSALKMFGGAPVHPRQDFTAWATSTVPSLTVGMTGFKALRLECCVPGAVSGVCSTVCMGGFSVPTTISGPSLVACGTLGASITAMACPPSWAPAGTTCAAPLSGPANPP